MTDPDDRTEAPEDVRLRIAEAHADALAAGTADPAARERAVADALDTDTDTDTDTDPRPVLEALDRTRAELARHGAESEGRGTPPTTPPDVLARIDRALAAERAGSERPRPLRRSGRVLPVAAAALAAAIAVIVAMLVGPADVPRIGDTAPDDPTVAAPDAPGTPRGGPPSGEVRPVLAREDPAAALRAGLGRADYGPLTDPERRGACLAAHGLDPRSVPVGGREVVVEGRPAVVLVLTTGTAARFRVLVVGTGCRADLPLTLANTVVGR